MPTDVRTACPWYKPANIHKLILSPLTTYYD